MIFRIVYITIQNIWKSGYLVTGAPYALSLLAFETQTIRFWTRVSEQLKKWAEKGKNPEANLVYDNALQAAHKMEKINEGLSEALMELKREG